MDFGLESVVQMDGYLVRKHFLPRYLSVNYYERREWQLLLCSLHPGVRVVEKSPSPLAAHAKAEVTVVLFLLLRKVLNTVVFKKR